MSLADLRQTPITGHAPVALEATHARPALALASLGVAGVGHAAEPVTVAQTRTACAVCAERGGFSVRAATVPRVHAFQHLDPLNWKKKKTHATMVTRPRENLDTSINT